jgi:exosortase/archaeosortase family protein
MDLTIAFRQLSQCLQSLFKTIVATRHRRRLALAALVAIVYLPTWGGILIDGILKGRSDSVLNFGFMALALQTLIQQRPLLRSLPLESDDRWTGYGLLLVATIGLVGLRTFAPSASGQALAVMGMLLGAIWSTWGPMVLSRLPLTIAMLLASVYPHLGYIAATFLRFFTGPDWLERAMAIGGSWGLSLIGHPAHAQGAIVHLGRGAVLVAPGCSGFDLALTLCGMGFLIGRFLQVSRPRTLMLMLAGLVMAWLANVPRIMLLALADVYWGKSAFDFWHGPIGGQIFAGIVFTWHYYLSMWVIESKSLRPQSLRAKS